MMKKQKEASWHVRMLTQEIRKSLDRHTILYTVKTSNILILQSLSLTYFSTVQEHIYIASTLCYTTNYTQKSSNH